MEMAQDCNQRKFGTRLSASIHPFRTGLFATETAIIRPGLQSTPVGPHYMRLTGTTVFGLSLCEGQHMHLSRTPWRCSCLVQLYTWDRACRITPQSTLVRHRNCRLSQVSCGYT